VSGAGHPPKGKISVSPFIRELVVGVRNKWARNSDEPSCQVILDEDTDLQSAITHLWHCGPSTTGQAIAAILDDVDVSSRALKRLQDWTAIDPKTCNWSFEPPATRKPRRRADHLRLVPSPEPEA
jgi:hypothetical protein